MGYLSKVSSCCKRKPRDGSPVVVLIGYLHVVNRLGEERGRNNSESFSYPHTRIEMERKMNCMSKRMGNMFR